MYTYADLKQSFTDRFYHNQSLNYVRALVKYNGRHTEQLDWHSKRDLEDCQYCSRIAYAAAASLAILCILPVYMYSKRRPRQTVTFNASPAKYSKLFNQQPYSTNTITTPPPIHPPRRHHRRQQHRSEHRQRLWGNTMWLALCAVPIVYSLSGTRINDHCYNDLLRHRTSDLARQCQLMYAAQQNKYIRPQPVSRPTKVTDGSGDTLLDSTVEHRLPKE